MKKANLDRLDIEELACYLAGLDYDEIDADENIIEEHIYAEFGIDLEQFTELINRLLPMIDVGKSPLTNKRYKGFAQPGIWLVKIEI